MPKSTKTPQSTPTRTRNRTRKTRTTTETSATSSLNHAESPLNGDESSPDNAASLNHDDIANRAYELFLSNGAMHGRDLEHWLQAESELRDRSVTAGR
jgi:hypothetical protein